MRQAIILLTIVSIIIVPVSIVAQEESSAVHVIQPGENLYRIAQKYGVTTSELADANGILDPTRVFSGQTLLIPGSNSQSTIVEATLTNETSGDIEVIIVPNGTTTEALPVQPGADGTLTNQPGIETTEAEATTVATEPLYHTISRGETLRNIANQYGTTETQLIDLNGLANPNRILAGQQLLIRNDPIVIEAAPVAQSASAAVADASAAVEPETAEIAPLIHTVQAGEYVSAIARRYGVDVNLLLAANNLSNPDRLLVGEQLVIPNGADAEAVAALLYPEPGASVGLGKEIVVDLSNSRVYAYENGILRYETVSSNGLPATPTVQGSFTVQSKVRSQTMSGPGYWLPNVEWVLYFYQGYALHGAYWHNNFGQPMSHGCVNLTNADARWFYEFAEIGTPVTVRY
jgi:LysM repeat protein